MIELAGSLLVASLVGSPHCAGMCGGFVCFVAGQATGSRRVLAHAAYHGGRLVSYAALGALAGLLGAGAEKFGARLGIAHSAGILAGALMVAWGLAGILGALGVGGFGRHRPGFAGRLLTRALRAVGNRPPEQRAVTIGILSTLLPCGWLYTFVAVAAGTGTPGAGALTMAIFWIGTVPVLAGLGLLAQRAFGPLRRWLPVGASAFVVALGLLSIAGKFRAPDAPACHTAHAAPMTPHAPDAGAGIATGAGSHAGH